MRQPKNETETHYLLKEIGKYILWSWGFTRIGTEVHGMYSCELDIGRTKKMDMKSIIDVVGLKRVRLGKSWNDPYGWDMRGIEAKASYSDFKNGFCVAPKNTYIIAPVGVIPVNELPNKIGLIEVDLDTVSVNKVAICNVEQSGKVKVDGINITVRARKRLDKRFKDEEQYQKFCVDTLQIIAYQNSRELLFWRNVIDIKDAM